MKKYLIANWKQNKTVKEVEKWFQEFAPNYKAKSGVSVVICAPYLYVSQVIWTIKKLNLENVFCGGQDVSEFGGGSHTGEVSAKQLKDFCEFVIVGHSERGEVQETVDIKTKNALEAGIMPILCIREASLFTDKYDPKVLLTWEDPANISKEGVYQTSANDSSLLSEVSKIRQVLGDRTLIYGGSVNPENIEFLDQKAKVDGYLVGHASLDAGTFLTLFNKIN